ncbi:MAG: hypothetical protein WD076_04385 [Parvularculaceae bacterium]
MKNQLSKIFSVAVGATLMIVSAHAQSGDEPELFSDLIHADLPIFAGDGTEKWPQYFSDEEGGFGCASLVAFGDWILRSGDETDDETGDEDAQWYGVENYGVFHCFALVSEAGDRKSLLEADARPSFFVKLGTSGGVELWAIQLGARPGSDYILLAREPAPGTISQFTVLQRRCPKGYMRDAGSLDILITRYCAINNKSELRSLARRMAKMKPLGTLVFVGGQKDEEE